MTYASDAVIGDNLTALRGSMSMDLLAAKMRNLGHNWTKTTVFNIEHGKRQLRLGEAADVLLSIGLDPSYSIGHLLIAPDEKKWVQAVNLACLRQIDFQSDFESYCDRIEELKQMLNTPEKGDERKSVRSIRAQAQQMVDEYERIKPEVEQLKKAINSVGVVTPIVYSNGEYHHFSEQEKESDAETQLGLMGAVPEDIEFMRKKRKDDGVNS